MQQVVIIFGGEPQGSNTMIVNMDFLPRHGDIVTLAMGDVSQSPLNYVEVQTKLGAEYKFSDIKPFRVKQVIHRTVCLPDHPEHPHKNPTFVRAPVIVVEPYMDNIDIDLLMLYV